MAKYENLFLCIVFPLLTPSSFYHPHPTKCQLGNSTTISAPIFSSLCSPTYQFSPLSLVQSLSHFSQGLFQIFPYHPQALYSTLLFSLLVENFASYLTEKIEAIRVDVSNFLLPQPPYLQSHLHLHWSLLSYPSVSEDEVPSSCLRTTLLARSCTYPSCFL